MFRWLDFKITNRCNRRCAYCGVPHDPPTAPELLPAAVVQNALIDALRVGFTHFALLGGEPSLREDVERVFDPFRGDTRAQSLMAITNGVVFSEALYRSLFDTNAEVATLVFSLDSLRKPNYKSQDPETSLRHLRAIQSIAEEYNGAGRRRSVSVHAVISRENLGDIESHMETLNGMDIDVSLALVCPARFIPDGLPRAYNEFTYAELESIIKVLEALNRGGRSNFGNRALLEYLKTYPFGRLRTLGACKAGRQVVIINPDGEVYPCIPESYGSGRGFGNISIEPFSGIYGRMARFECRNQVSAACWDHFLWDRLADEAELQWDRGVPPRATASGDGADQ